MDNAYFKMNYDFRLLLITRVLDIHMYNLRTLSRFNAVLWENSLNIS